MRMLYSDFINNFTYQRFVCYFIKLMYDDDDDCDVQPVVGWLPAELARLSWLAAR